MSADPYQASGGPGNPGSWNRYVYTLGDPVNLFDPTGLDAKEACEYWGGYWDEEFDRCIDTSMPNNPCANNGCLQNPQPGQPAASDGKTAREHLLAAITDAIGRIKNNPACKELFGSAKTRDGKWDPEKVLDNLYTALTTSPGASPISIEWMDDRGASTRVTAGGLANRYLPGLKNNRVTITLSIEDAEAGGDHFVHTVLHELGHAYDLLDGSGGSKIQSPDALPGIFGGAKRSRENDYLVDQACFGGALGYPNPNPPRK